MEQSKRLPLARNSSSFDKGWRDTFIGYAFVPPFLILFIVFTLCPIVQGFWISLHNWELVGTNIQYIGLNNNQRLLNDKLFWSSLEHTVFFVILSGPVLVVVGLLFALMLNRKIHGMGVFRTLFYMPNILSVAVVGLIFARIFASDQRGLINAVLTAARKPSYIGWFYSGSIRIVIILSLVNCAAAS